MSEQWDAVLFVPQYDVQASVLEAAIGYISGTRLITLGVYNADPNEYDIPGIPLPGGVVSTTQIPDLGGCCQLTKVTLPGGGVTLKANTIYWLVAKPDDSKGADFSGGWAPSNTGAAAGLRTGYSWFVRPGEWLAGQVKGSRAKSPSTPLRAPPATAAADPEGSADSLTIFSSLGNPQFPDLYVPNAGILICGKDSSYGFDLSQALPFTARVSGRAKTLAAAIGWSGGTREVVLGLYADNNGVPGTPLQGGEGSTTGFDNFGDCCVLATVKLPGKGVSLTKGVKYWMVASPDDVNAPDFEGSWLVSDNNNWAFTGEGGPNGWTFGVGDWLAARITGTSQ